jgi:hypothetical protein
MLCCTLYDPLRRPTAWSDTFLVGHSEHNGVMRQKPNVTTVHIVEGQPWKEALISVLEPRSPYRPWQPATNIEPGDAVIAILDTDPESVLAGIGIVGPNGDVGDAFATIKPFYLNVAPRVRHAQHARGLRGQPRRWNRVLPRLAR